MTGPPGAGKSTVAQAIIDSLGVSEGPTALVEGDAFFAFLAGGAIDPWLPESHRQNTVVTETMALAAGRFASAEFITIFDGVLGP